MTKSKKAMFLENLGSLAGRTLEEAAQILQTTPGVVENYIYELGDAISVKKGRIKIKPGAEEEVTPLNRHIVLTQPVSSYSGVRDRKLREDGPDFIETGNLCRGRRNLGGDSSIGFNDSLEILDGLARRDNVEMASYLRERGSIGGERLA